MPKFQVLCRVDAFVDYIAEVDATDATEAAWLANSAEGLEWREQGVVELDDRLWVTLDENGDPIDETQCGDF